MKIVRVSIILAVAGLLFAAVMSSCRHGSPTGPTDTTNTADSCCHGRIALTVYDSVTGHALDGGLVTLFENDHRIASQPMRDSGIVFDGLCPGNYHFTISKDGYHTATFRIDSMGCNAVRRVHHTLSPIATNDDCCHGRIALVVYDSATGHLLDGGSVTLYKNDHPVATQPMHDSTVFDGLCPGVYRFTISKDGYRSVTFAIDSLGCNALRRVHHTLSPIRSDHDCCHGILEIGVRDSTHGEAITGATVLLTNRTTGAHYFATTTHGQVRFDGLCPGNYLCQISDPHFDSYGFDFQMTCNDTLSFKKSLTSISAATCDTASITIRVRDSVHQDLNIAGATVTLRIDGHHDTVASGTTDSTGYYFSEHNLPSPATYVITITKDGYHSKTVILQLSDCRNYGEVVYLSRD